MAECRLRSEYYVYACDFQATRHGLLMNSVVLSFYEAFDLLHGMGDTNPMYTLSYISAHDYTLTVVRKPERSFETEIQFMLYPLRTKLNLDRRC